MTIWQGVLIILAAVSAIPALYGLYRLIVWMKQRGWLSWRNQRTGSSAMGCFVAMQQIIEPTVQHVQELKTRRAPGSKSTPTADGSRAEGA